MPKTLLLADDSVTIQKVVRITLANEDIELVTADNGDHALVRARQIKPDLVLADIGMPGLDGYALCKAIREDPTIAHTPVLLLTGTFETYDEQKAQEVGASGYISKPFEAQVLVSRVLAMLAESAAPQIARPSAAARTVAAPAARSAPAAPQPPRLELPPLPGAGSAKPARPASPRVFASFDFEVTQEPVPNPGSLDTPLWEGLPALEDRDDAALPPPTLRSALPRPSEVAPPAFADATRVFTPDPLGQPASREYSPDRAPAPAAAHDDFSFADLDFEEPSDPDVQRSEVFGESSDPLGAKTGRNALTAPESSNERKLEAPLSDPLYSSTRFLFPDFATEAGPDLDTPLPARAAARPYLPASDEVTTPTYANEEIDLSDTELEIEVEEVDESDPLAVPFSPNTHAAFKEPEFERGNQDPLSQSNPLAVADDDLELEADLDLVDDGPILDEDLPELPSELDTWRKSPESREPDPRPSAPLAVRGRSEERPRVATPVIDSALLSNALEKVAWEAFGSLSEQVVNEVRKRIEAVVWEIVPELCERQIREEIARLKADLPE